LASELGPKASVGIPEVSFVSGVHEAPHLSLSLVEDRQIQTPVLVRYRVSGRLVSIALPATHRARARLRPMREHPSVRFQPKWLARRRYPPENKETAAAEA
jgi:hypothetical protein